MESNKKTIAMGKIFSKDIGPIGEKIEKAAGCLPEGWCINICVENGAAWVEIQDPEGIAAVIDVADMGLPEQIEEGMREIEICVSDAE